jgi:UPF0755 protein
MFLIRLLVWLINLAIVLGVVGVLLAGAGFFIYSKPGPLTETRTVIIERGAGLREITANLREAGVIADPPIVFMAGALATGKRGLLKAGEYEFPAAISMAGVANMIAAGDVVIHKITVVDGMTVKEVLAALEADKSLTGAVSNTPAEGTLLPETYFFNRGDSRDELIARMQRAHREVLEQAWKNRAPGLPLKSAQEALILASIIEKETGVAKERPQVAGVFINRLRKGMKLQSDPTAIYPLSNFTGNLGRELTRKDLETPSPYNTYYAEGLPPGPIANPGAASIHAALQPQQHDYYYFVADGTGGHAFGRTLDEHNRNVARWRQVQRERN